LASSFETRRKGGAPQDEDQPVSILLILRSTAKPRISKDEAPAPESMERTSQMQMGGKLRRMHDLERRNRDDVIDDGRRFEARDVVADVV